LGYRITAEGIEASDIQAELRLWGCDEGQGYHICRPVPADRLIDWISKRRAAGPTG